MNNTYVLTEVKNMKHAREKIKSAKFTQNNCGLASGLSEKSTFLLSLPFANSDLNAAISTAFFLE